MPATTQREALLHDSGPGPTKGPGADRYSTHYCFGAAAETADRTGRGGSSGSEPRPSDRRKSAVVARNDGRPRLPKRGSSSINFRASSVSITPLLSVARMLLIRRG